MRGLEILPFKGLLLFFFWEFSLVPPFIPFLHCWLSSPRSLSAPEEEPKPDRCNKKGNASNCPSNNSPHGL